MFVQLLQWLSQMMFMALHVLRTGSFPKPLSPEEEREMLCRYHRDGDQDARAALIEHNLRLVAHIVKKYSHGAADPDDLISIGTIGLIKAVETFDCSKQNRFVSYASRCIENEILMHFRANRKTLSDISVSEPIDTDKEGHPLTLLDILADEDDMVGHLEDKLNGAKLHRYIAECLDDREKEVLGLRYGLFGRPLTQREVGRKLDISRSYVSRIEKAALQKLRDRFERGDPIPPKQR